MTDRRRRTSLSAIKTTLQARRESGMQPAALETLPDGTIRGHFTPHPAHNEDALDRELASVVVRIYDRGPFVGSRVIDLSKSAASAIDMIGSGTAKVTIEVLA